MDPFLRNILERNFIKKGSVNYIVSGDTEIQYHNEFKLFMTSIIQNVNVPIDVAVHVTVVNFSVMLSGLEEQLLGDLILQEHPDLENQYQSFLNDQVADTRALYEFEDLILKQIGELQNRILDSDMLIETLN